MAKTPITKSANTLTNSVPPARYPEVRKAIDMANQLLNKQEFGPALDLCARVINLEPENPEIHFTAASILDAGGNVEQALEAYARVLELLPNFIPAITNCAMILVDNGRFSDAIALFERGLKADPQHGGLLQAYAQVLRSLRREEKAVKLVAQVLKQHPDFIGFIELGSLYDKAGSKHEALQAFEKALSMSDAKAPIYVLMARVVLMHNERDEAASYIEQALQHDNDDGFANLIKAQHFTADDEIDAMIDKLQLSIERTSSRAPQNYAVPLNFALARLLERKGKLAEAYDAFSTGNQLLAQHQPQEDDQRIKHFKDVADQFTEPALNKLRDVGDKSDAPVFILGMPRSGTTLVEQLLASHDEVIGLDEFELFPVLARGLDEPNPARVKEAAAHYMTSLAKDARSAKRFTDKSISSFHHAAQIAAVFPNARFIAVERHPMDIAWSAYKEYFGTNALVFAYDFSRIIKYLKLHNELLPRWQKLLGERLLTVRYEDLVGDTEYHAKAMVEHIGLDWQPEILNFYETNRAVRTASLAQVRQPVYATSVGGWKRYQQQLQPIAAQMADLIAQYEQADS